MHIKGHPDPRKTSKPKTNMKTLNEILETVIKHDPALNGFTRESLPLASKARIQNTLVSLERNLDAAEVDQLEKWTGGRGIFEQAEGAFSEGECCYYVYSDGSLYFRSSGDSEVWTFASDFADDRIINGYDGALDEIDSKLLKHLGGRFEIEMTERGVRT